MLKAGFSQNLPKRGVCEGEEQVQSRASSWCPSKHRNQNAAVPERLFPRAVTVHNITTAHARWDLVYI